MTNFSAETVGRQPGEVVLYTRLGCHLCEDAEAILAEFGLRPRKIDVDTAPDLAALHGTCVPVVVIDGRVRFRGRVDRLLLRRLLASIPANPGPPGAEPADG